MQSRGHVNEGFNTAIFIKMPNFIKYAHVELSKEIKVLPFLKSREKDLGQQVSGLLISYASLSIIKWKPQRK